MIVVSILAIGVPFASTVIDSSRFIAGTYRLDELSVDALRR